MVVLQLYEGEGMLASHPLFIPMRHLRSVDFPFFFLACASVFSAAAFR